MNDVWACEGCFRIGRSPRDLLAQGCEGKPERYVPETELASLRSTLAALEAERDEMHDAGNVVARNLSMCVDAIATHAEAAGISGDDFAPLQELKDKGSASLERWMQAAALTTERERPDEAT